MTKPTVSEMLRTTSENLDEFYKQIADHIDQLGHTIDILTTELRVYKDLEKKEQDDFK